MSVPVVSDSACLIGLDEIGQLDILKSLFQEIIIPPEVAAECKLTPRSWIRIQAPTDQNMVCSLKTMVDDGEAEALALAKELNLEIIVDDFGARIVGNKMGLIVTGTGGVLVRAKKAGVIPLVKPILDELVNNGFYLSQTVQLDILRLAGE